MREWILESVCAPSCHAVPPDVILGVFQDPWKTVGFPVYPSVFSEKIID